MQQLRTKKQRIVLPLGKITVVAEPWTARETRTKREEFTEIVGRGLDRREKFDDIGFGEAMFVDVVKSWDGATDENGEPLPCTPENKKEVYAFDQNFCEKVLDGIRDAIENRKDLNTKN